MNKYIVASLLILIMAACSPDPRDQAEAEQIVMEAEQNAADQEQERQQAAETYALELQEKQATSASRVQAIQTITKVTSIAGAIGLAVVILSAGFGFGLAFVGSGKAAARLAMVRANTLPLDKVTRSFPAVFSYVGRGRYTLTDPNSGATHFLDTRNEPDRQLISVLGAVRLAGVVAQEARKSSDPAGLAVYQPVVISGEPYENLSTNREREPITISTNHQ